MTALAERSPQRCEAYDESEHEDNWTKTRKHVSTVWCICFSDSAENLGLGEVSTSCEQNVPRIAEVCKLQNIKRSEEDGRSDCKCSKNEQPRLVTESSCNEHDDNGEQEDEKERLKAGSVQHQVQLWVRIERQRNQEIGQQHCQEQRAQDG